MKFGKKTIAALLCIAVLVAVGIGMAVSQNDQPAQTPDDYAAAEQLLADGNYLEAAAAFARLGDQDKVRQCHYARGVQMQ